MTTEKATGWLVTGTCYSEDPVMWEEVDVMDFLTQRLDDGDDLKTLEVVPLYEGEGVAAAEWHKRRLAR